MKFAAFPILFALSASVLALPADDPASPVKRQDSCDACLEYCATEEDVYACEQYNCALVCEIYRNSHCGL